jgi:hypothetical protein
MKTKIAFTVALVFWIFSIWLILEPETAIALNNRIFQRENKQGYLFLTKEDREIFTAFGEEQYIRCDKPCRAEEWYKGSALYICDSKPGWKEHVCAARFWPGRQYVVEVQKAKAN